MSQSIEPDIAQLGNGWLKSYNLDYKLEQAKLNDEIDNALEIYFSKNGGVGGNLPDAKLLTIFLSVILNPAQKAKIPLEF